jgi:O-antigen ligase
VALLRPLAIGPSATPENELRARGIFRQVIFIAILIAVWISTRPFYVMPADGSSPSADIVNQLTFSGLAAAGFLGFCMTDRRAFAPMLQPSYVLLVAWMACTVVMSTEIGISFRAFAFALIMMFLAACLFVLPERFKQFQTLLVLTALATMAFSYFGLIALPDLAMHTDFDPREPEHAGSWKGHFDHKNIAGASMAVFAIIGIYAVRQGQKRIGYLLVLGGFVFLYFTKSKTSLGLLPFVILLALLAERIPVFFVRALLCLGPIVLLLTMTLGAVLVPEIEAMNKLIMRDSTFTGRHDIWRYGFEMLAAHPWTGYGFEAFWQTTTTLQGESRLELSWAVEKIVHGHNSYLDVALTLGLPGLALVGYVFVVKPLRDYHACQPSPDNQKLATMFLMMWLFISLGMCLETYYFRRADPVWFSLLIAVFGLRFTAAYRVDQ